MTMKTAEFVDQNHDHTGLALGAAAVIEVVSLAAGVIGDFRHNERLSELGSLGKIAGVAAGYMALTRHFSNEDRRAHDAHIQN
jgi:hypothetical protein